MADKLRVEALINGEWEPVQAIAACPKDQQGSVTFDPVPTGDSARERLLEPKLENALEGKTAAWVTFTDGTTVLYVGSIGPFRIAPAPSEPFIAHR